MIIIMIVFMIAVGVGGGWINEIDHGGSVETFHEIMICGYVFGFILDTVR